MSKDREGFFGRGAVGGADDEGDGEFVTTLGGGDDAHAIGAEGRIEAARGAGDVLHPVAAHGEEAHVLHHVHGVVQCDLAVAVQRGEGFARVPPSRAGGRDLFMRLRTMNRFVKDRDREPIYALIDFFAYDRAGNRLVNVTATRQKGTSKP